MSLVLPVPPHRAIRAALFAVVCVGVAAALHDTANECRVSWPALGIGMPTIWLAACAGLGRERSGPALTAGLAVTQVGLHYLFAHVQSGMPLGTTAPDASMPAMPGMALPQSDPRLTTLSMLCAHALAVVVCGWWLRHGERDFFALCLVVAVLAAAPLRWLTGAVALLRRLAHTYGYDLPRALCAPLDRPKRRRSLLLTTLFFRGPPVLA